MADGIGWTNNMLVLFELSQKGREAYRDFWLPFVTEVESAIKKLPDGREKEFFLSHIELSLFFAARAIASAPGNHVELE